MISIRTSRVDPVSATGGSSTGNKRWTAGSGATTGMLTVRSRPRSPGTPTRALEAPPIGTNVVSSQNGNVTLVAPAGMRG